MQATAIDSVLERAGTGRFQRRLLGIFGLVWAADAMQVLAVGFTVASIAATFGMTVPEALQTGILFFLGMMVGAALFGRLADKFGRRRILLVTVAMDAVFGIASAFAPDFATLLVLRFLTGMAVGGTLPVDYAMMAEFLPPKRRGRWLVMLEGFWAVGTVIVALTAWAATTAGVTEIWRVIFFVTAAPAVLGIFLRIWIPESPMHLLRQGDEPGARRVLDKVLQTNGQPPLAAEARLVLPETGTAEGIFSPGLLRRTLLMLAVWFLVSMSYYGVFTWMPAQLATQGFGFVRGYGFLVLLALAQIPGYVLAAWGVEAWGRRPTLVAFLVLSSAACLLFVVAASPWLIATALMVMSFALLGTWGALYAFTPELYPTGSRATGMGAAGAMARLGGLLAPSVLVHLFIQSTSTAIGLFAGLLLLAALLARLIDAETRSKALN
ncbi:MFS transporter [Pseudogemmobacter faecipullorum]|uniref:MFS transporter n=1 Tax=Pseudogemmobacter faecipullorum TaxID=2755041 RepID=A0ABS8CJK8_9RHOB|nr:MFS transporter [Pseudogemmobacter faecipullorum]MCB5409555.1 MFS transporter [Pseudogemmobacter faecipullorum]